MAAPSIPVVNAYVGQTYAPLYVSVDSNPLTEVQSITLNRVDGGAEVLTIQRGWAGRVTGAPKTNCTLKGVIPYEPSDVPGNGFNNQGMITGKGYQFDAVMLTNINQNGSVPVSFIISIGGGENGPASAQQLLFKGFVISVDVDYTIGGQANFTVSAEGNFAIFQ